MRHRRGRPASGSRIAGPLVDGIGVAIGVRHLRAVGLRQGHLTWALESALADDDSLEAALGRFLRTLPLHWIQRWVRPSVRVVLGSRHAQVKRLTGLPPGLDARQLARVVQEGAPRFFLRNGHPLLTTGVDIAANGASWSAALDADIVDAVHDACRGAGLRLTGIGPAVAALPLALEGSAMEDGDGEEVRWEDEGERIAVRMVGGRIARVARLDRVVDGPASADEVGRALSRPRSLLAPLAERSQRFADAYGAALLPGDAPLLHRPRRAARVSSGERSPIPRWRLAAASVALLLAGCSALLLRPLTAMRAEHAATARLAELGPLRAEAARMQHDLAQVSAALADVERFAGSRRSPTLLLAGLARALPEGSALVTVRLESDARGRARTGQDPRAVTGADTTGVVVTLLAPRAAPVLGAIEKLPGVVAPQLVGPVTREVAGGASVSAVGRSVERTTLETLERMTVRFRLTSAAARGAGAVDP